MQPCKWRSVCGVSRFQGRLLELVNGGNDFSGLQKDLEANDAHMSVRYRVTRFISAAHLLLD